MEIRLKVEQLDYAELAAAVLPLIKSKLGGMSGPVPALLNGVASLPDGMVKAVVNGLPKDVKEQTAVFLINNYKDQIIAAVEKVCADAGISVKLGDVIAHS